MPRLNVFQNYPVMHDGPNNTLLGNGSLHVFGVYIPGSISFNTIALFFTASGTTAKTASISFGLYSLNGSTLSLANSASTSTNPTANTGLWITLSTSANQDITPGNWYFAVMSSTSSNSRMSLGVNPNFQAFNFIGGYGGPFVKGVLSASTTAMPASIATSDLSKEGSNSNQSLQFQPYILIAA